MSEQLTPKQENVLNKLTEYISKHGQAPTIEEMQHTLWLKSKRWVVQYLEALERKGYITRWRWYRAIRLGNDVWFQQMINIPILWTANAWRALTFAWSNDNWFLPVFKSVLKWDVNNYFCVKIEWNSMNQCEINGKKILNWAYILVNAKSTKVNEREPFLFILDNCATVKKCKKEGNNIYLLPESDDKSHHPIVVSATADDLQINWQVVDVFNF